PLPRRRRPLLRHLLVIEWLPVFVAEAPCKIVCDGLNFCHKNKGLRVNAFVIMPRHLGGIGFSMKGPAPSAGVTSFGFFLAFRCPFSNSVPLRNLDCSLAGNMRIAFCRGSD